jgi:hypothetical protein
MMMFAVAKNRLKPRLLMRPRSAPGQIVIDAQQLNAGRALIPFAAAISWLKPIPPMRPRCAPGPKAGDTHRRLAGRALPLPVIR